MTPDRPSLETYVSGLADAGVEVAHGHGPQLARAIEVRQRLDAGEFAIDESFDPNP